MGLLPWSFGFLVVFSLLLWTQLKTVTETSILHTISLTSLEEAGARVSEAIEEAASNNQDKQGKQGKKSRSSHPHQGVRTSKLHLDRFFAKDIPNNGPSRKETQKKILFRLIEILYGNQPIFSKGDNTAAVTALFEKVFAKGEEIESLHPRFFSKAEDLALISLRDDPAIPNAEHSAYYHMLRGGKNEIINGTRCKLEGLRYYISLRSHENTIMSIYLAPKKLLLALFGPEKEDVVNELLAYRQEVWKDLHKGKGKNKDELEKEFKDKYFSQLPPDIGPDCIDFKISTTQPQNSPRKPTKLKYIPKD